MRRDALQANGVCGASAFHGLDPRIEKEDVSDKLQQVQILHVWHGARQEPTF
jgi:hypothetical protein